MTRTRLAALALGAVLVIALVAALVVRGGDDGGDGGPDGAEPGPSASAGLPVVADETWCASWMDLVAVQGQYVADPTSDASAALLATVEELQALGVPESLDPAGYTELTAVLDDVRASVDPSFTPSVVPTEPADVVVEDEHDDDHADEHEDEHEDEHGDHGAGADEAPFGAWLAEHCSV